MPMPDSAASESPLLLFLDCSHGVARGTCAMQDRFEKAPDIFKISDEDEGLCFNWAPEAISLSASPAS